MTSDSLLTTPFFIGNVQIPGRVILAPMDGYTDSPFRSICRQFGSAASYSEFINGIDVVNGHPHLKYKLFFTEPERPFVYQIFDDNPERLLETAKRLEALGPDIIDINMGCSAKNVSNRGAGAGLLKDPIKIGNIVSLLKAQIAVPVTAKIRLGWDDSSKNFLEITHILQENGIDAITVHARTRRQEYSGIADWNAIAEVRQLAKVPVIGNGDVSSLVDAQRKMKQTNCDAVMIGREAIGNPWVFSGTDTSLITNKNRFDTINDHLIRMCDLFPPHIAVTIFRKHLVRYLRGYLTTPEIRKSIFSITDRKQLMDEVAQLLNYSDLQE